ncbi:MAG: metal-dependent hydrolase [Leptospiraceae bacterium]|nr:metal-dependent hydrolase [Leptospiraceae bacterium]MDW8305567.1 metal-dependent hydrolase [Leptospiraceae bacterium]
MEVRINRESYEEVPKIWFEASPLQNYVLSILSHMFPDGERFFIRAVKRYADRVTDPKFQEEIKAFIGQEMQHGLAHERFNRAIQEATGADLSWFMWLFTVPLFDKLEKYLTERGLAYRFALGCTAAAENMTAAFAENVFKNPEAMEKMRKDIRYLFEWHAAEEIEHRHIAFDLYKAAGASYGERIASAIFTYLLIWFYVVVGTSYLILKDRDYPWHSLPKELIDFFMKENALGRITIESFFDYLRADFHPNDRPIPHKAEEFLEQISRQKVA